MNHARPTSALRSSALATIIVAGALVACVLAISALEIRSLDGTCTRPPRMASGAELRAYEACVQDVRDATSGTTASSTSPRTTQDTPR
jgi:hypothetical protein